MQLDQALADQIRDLCDRIQMGSCDQPSLDKLAEIIASNEAACEYYLRYTSFLESLAHTSLAHTASDNGHTTANDLQPDNSVSLPPQNRKPSPPGYVQRIVSIGLATATALMFIVPLLYLTVTGRNRGQVQVDAPRHQRPTSHSSQPTVPRGRQTAIAAADPQPEVRVVGSPTHIGLRKETADSRVTFVMFYPTTYPNTQSHVDSTPGRRD